MKNHARHFLDTIASFWNNRAPAQIRNPKAGSEIRSPNDEIRKKSETRNPKSD
jgi:hypothetical protein